MNSRRWMVRRACVCCVLLVLTLFTLVACKKDAAESTPGPVGAGETTTQSSNVVGDWKMKIRGTTLVSKATLSLAQDGTFTYTGQRGETVDSGKYWVDGDELNLEGESCTSAGGVKVSPCVGVYKVSVTQGDTDSVLVLQLVKDPSLSRSLELGGQDFALAK